MIFICLYFAPRRLRARSSSLPRMGIELFFLLLPSARLVFFATSSIDSEPENSLLAPRGSIL